MKTNFAKYRPEALSATLKTLTVLAMISIAWVSRAQNFSSEDTVTEYNATATYYADKFVGRKTSSGEIFTQDKYTAAHHTIKFGTLVLVTNQKNGKQVIVKVNDRCPRRTVIDLTRKGIGAIGIKGAGKVTIRILPKTYQYAWEHQDEIRDPESGRLVLTTPAKKKTESETAKEDAIPAKTAIKPLDTARQEKPKTAEKKNGTEPKKDGQTRYDLLLATGVARAQAEKQINKLPMHLRECVQQRPDQTSGKLKLVLTIRANEKKAKETQRTLKPRFPDCQVIASE